MKKVFITSLAAFIVMSLVVFILWPASQVFLVLFAAVLFAILVNALADLIPIRIGTSRFLARVFVILLLALLLGTFILFAGPRFSDQMSQLSKELPRAIEHLQSSILAQPWSRLFDNLNINYPLPDAAQILTGVTGVFSTVLEAVTNSFVIFFIGLYLAINPAPYLSGFLHLVPKQYRERTTQFLQAIDHALSWWMLGRFTSMVAVGILTTLGLAIIGIPLALVLGVIAGLFSFVPYIGPIISAIPAILIGLMQSPQMAAYVTGIYILVQFIEGNFLTPFIQRQAVNLPPAVLLSFQFAMAIFYGVFGVLLATPLAVLIIVMIQVLYVQHVLKDPVSILGQHGDKKMYGYQQKGMQTS